MVDVKRVKLPGVGVLHTFVTDGGGKIGVITHRSGHSDLIAFADAEEGSDATKVACDSTTTRRTPSPNCSAARASPSRSRASTRSPASRSTGSPSTMTITSRASRSATSRAGASSV